MTDQLRNKRIFYISSGNQLSGSSSTFSTTLQIPTHEDYNRVTVLALNIPVSYYLVQQGFNHFYLNESATRVKLYLPIGNYNVNSFTLEITQLLNANSPLGFKYTADYDSSFKSVDTGKITYTVNSGIVPVSFQFDLGNPVNEQFGFNNGSTVYFNQGVTTTSTLVSTNVINFIPENSLFVHCNLVNSGTDDILQEVNSGNTVPFSNITFLNPDPLSNSKALSSNTIQNVTFSLTNESNIPIFLNGVSMSLTMMLYQDNQYYSKSLEYMKYQISKDTTRDLAEEHQGDPVIEN